MQAKRELALIQVHAKQLQTSRRVPKAVLLMSVQPGLIAMTATPALTTAARDFPKNVLIQRKPLAQAMTAAAYLPAVKPTTIVELVTWLFHRFPLT